MTEVSIESDRLRLRSWRTSDFKSMWRLFGDSEVMRYIPMPPIDSEERARSVFERLLKIEDKHGMCFWVVEDKKTGAFLGDCGLKPLNPDEDEVEIEVGYHFLTEYWGRGYATEAARAAIAHGFLNLGLERIVGVVLPGNDPSMHVLEKAGLRRLGRRQAYGHDTVYFALTREEWREHVKSAPGR